MPAKKPRKSTIKIAKKQVTVDTPLSDREKLFVEEYFKDFSVRDAYVRTAQQLGITVNMKTASTKGSGYLNKPNIQNAIRNKQAAKSVVNEVTQEWVVETLVRNIKRAMQEEAVLDKHGNPTGEYVYNGSVVNRACELLGKRLGMFVDKTEVKGQIDHVHSGVTAALTGEDLAKLPLDVRLALLDHIRSKRNEPTPVPVLPAPDANGVIPLQPLPQEASSERLPADGGTGVPGVCPVEAPDLTKLDSDERPSLRGLAGESSSPDSNSEG